MRILWHSNSPWAKTGYGNQTAMFWHRLQALGYPVVLSSNYGLQGSTLNIEAEGQQTQVYPGAYDGRGMISSCRTPGTRRRTLSSRCTTPGYSTTSDESRVGVRGCRWITTRRRRQSCGRSRRRCKPSRSRFGQDRLKMAGIDAAYVPHGVDTRVMRPYRSERGKEKDSVSAGSCGL